MNNSLSYRTAPRKGSGSRFKRPFRETLPARYRDKLTPEMLRLIDNAIDKMGKGKA